MELITGRKALNESQGEESVHLVTFFRRALINKDNTFHKAIDPTIDLDEGTFNSVTTVAELAGHCCAREPYQRPDMAHAVNVLSSLVEHLCCLASCGFSVWLGILRVLAWFGSVIPRKAFTISFRKRGASMARFLERKQVLFVKDKYVHALDFNKTISF